MKQNNQLTAKSFKQLHSMVTPKTESEEWQSFLKLKGHTEQTFACLPGPLQMDLKFSYARKKELN